MNEICSSPNISSLEIPMDTWTQPFWEATANQKLLLPACVDCEHFRWPPGPFCPCCQSQATMWLPSGTGHIYSFTIVRETSKETHQTKIFVPALIEFPAANGVRLLAAIVDTQVADIAIGKEVQPRWIQSANATVPAFHISN